MRLPVGDYCRPMSDQHRDISALYAAKAVEVAEKLKPGTYDAVQAMALISIAHSLARIAESLERP